MSLLRWKDVRAALDRLASRLAAEPEPVGVYGVPTGGCVVAAMLSEAAGLRMLDEPETGSLVVDDLVDSGRTLRAFADRGLQVDALFRKQHSPPDLAPGATPVTGWVRFPWEHQTGAEENVVRLLEYVGEDPTRPGLADTPARYLRALRELTRGYGERPEEILSRVFEERYDQMVLVRGVEFWSLCEHHLLPFRGEATVGYLPKGRILGLSKIARLIQCFARRLQVQERLTEQVAHALDETLRPLGVGVLVRGWHTCMSMRGVRSGGEMLTSCLLGAIRDQARSEFLDLARRDRS